MAAAALALSLVGLHPAAATARSPVRQLLVSQVQQTASRPPRLRAFLDVLDANGKPPDRIDPEELWATLGGTPLQVDRLTPFESSGEGVAYGILVDVSHSLGDEQLAAIREELVIWTASLAAGDRIAVLSFGDETRLLADFTADAAELRAALQSLRPSGERTVLHLALRDGLRLAARRDRDLPGRRALILLSDGRDEGSGLTAEDVLALLDEERTPIYAVGSSRLRGEERRRHLEALHRFASSSGGAFFELEYESLSRAFSRTRAAVRRVWVADFTCPTCAPEGSLERFQVRLRQEERVLSDGTQVRLLNFPPEPGEAPAAAAAPAPARTGLWLTAAAGLLLAGLAVRAALGRRRPARGEPIETEEFEIPLPPPDPAPHLGREPPPVRAPAPWTPPEEPVAPPAGPEDEAAALPVRRLRFVVVRGSRRGRSYDLELAGRAVVGSGPDCDCELDEPDIAPIQFEVSQEAGGVMIRNLAPRHPTLLDGHPVDGPRALRDRALVGGRSTILRVEIGD